MLSAPNKTMRPPRHAHPANLCRSPKVGDPLRQLAAAVVVQAMREASAGDKSAVYFLADDADRNPWLILAGVDNDAMIGWLENMQPIPRKHAGRPKKSP